MYVLGNNELIVEVLDPLENRALLGSRYCTGGYIFQVKDCKLGPLLSGPQFPDPHFNVFHGQGAPEVFVTAINQDKAGIGEEVLVIGVGLVTRTSPVIPFHVRDNPVVKEFCRWKAQPRDDRISMETVHEFGDSRIYLKRTILLNGRTVISCTRIQNTGKTMVPINWFAHPFFPIPGDAKTCLISTPCRLPGNEGYYLDDQGFVAMNPGYGWKKGLYQKTDLEKKEILSVEQCHPVIGRVNVRCDFIPHSLALWANDRTFSFEPFLEARVESGGQCRWSIGYTFCRAGSAPLPSPFEKR